MRATWSLLIPALALGTLLIPTVAADDDPPQNPEENCEWPVSQEQGCQYCVFTDLNETPPDWDVNLNECLPL